MSPLTTASPSPNATDTLLSIFVYDTCLDLNKKYSPPNSHRTFSHPLIPSWKSLTLIWTKWSPTKLHRTPLTYSDKYKIIFKVQLCSPLSIFFSCTFPCFSNIRDLSYKCGVRTTYLYCNTTGLKMIDIMETKQIIDWTTAKYIGWKWE